MRSPLTKDSKLNELSMNLDYWRWKYDNSHHFFKNEYHKKYEEAKKEFGEYYGKAYPQVKPILEVEKYVRLDDKTEYYENFEN